MNLAIQQAKLGGSDTYTNPRVGAILVKDKRVLAQGYHHFYGGNHAEVDVLNKVSDKDAAGATLFVTLEPCSHYGKTPPCVQRIVDSGIKKVVIGQLDPHPIVAGKGRKILIDHGIAVTTGVLKKEVEKLNLHYNLYYRKSRPWITLKSAMTLDGKINLKENVRSIISSHDSYLDSQNLRTNFQAILIGEHTLQTDDPQLTVRIKHMQHPPVRIAVLNSSDIALGKKIIKPDDVPTWLLVKNTCSFDQQIKQSANVHILKGDWRPTNISNFCYQNGWQSLLVEGGSAISHLRFLEATRYRRYLIRVLIVKK